MELKHIDTGFFQLNRSQAIELSVDGKLPRPGYEKRAKLIPPGVKLLFWHSVGQQWREAVRPIPDGCYGWIMETPVGGERVLAIRFCYPSKHLHHFETSVSTAHLKHHVVQTF